MPSNHLQNQGWKLCVMFDRFFAHPAAMVHLHSSPDITADAVRSPKVTAAQPPCTAPSTFWVAKLSTSYLAQEKSLDRPLVASR